MTYALSGVENLSTWVICFILNVWLQPLTPHLVGEGVEEVVMRRKMEAPCFKLWEIILRIIFKISNKYRLSSRPPKNVMNGADGEL